MENIESTIVELGSIFQELAHMVKEQEEQIQRLENAEFLLGFLTVVIQASFGCALIALVKIAI